MSSSQLIRALALSCHPIPSVAVTAISAGLGRVPQIRLGGISEPDHDAGDVDGPLVDELSFVVAGSDPAVTAKPVDSPLDGVAVLLDLLIESRWPSARRTPRGAARDLVRRLRDGGLDTPTT